VGSSSSAKAKGAQTLSILVCRSIWCERNARVFHGEEKSITRTVTEIRDEAMLWIKAGAKHLAVLVAGSVSE
jgi:hypothetical protein